jgi:hypothetical protein
VTLAAYKVLHILGVVFLFTGFGALLATAWPGGKGNDVPAALRKRSGLTHGVALLIVLVSGFGMLAKIGVGHDGAGWGLWIWLKLAIWLALGAVIVVARRQPRLAPMLWFLLPLLGGAAAYLAIYKPA